jgi:GNAT superfamily N-acetyltransferase
MIRPATEADLPRLIELGEAMHAESRYCSMQFDTEKVGALLAGLLKTGFVIVSVKDGRIIGGFVGMISEHWFSREKLATDLALFIEPDARGGTTAWRLVDAFLDWAHLNGAKCIDIGVNTGVHTDRTAQLYERLGGQRVGLLYSFEGA